MSYKGYTDQDIIIYASEVKSLAALLRKLGLKQAGGNYANMRRKLQLLGVDTSHFTGQLWSKGDQLKDWKDYTVARSLKPHLIDKRGRRCERCSNAVWCDQPITIELHHIDGDRTHNDEDNLQLLCPNCHALTENWRNKARKKNQLWQ